MGLMISSIAKIGNENLPKNLIDTSDDFYLYILEYSDFDFQETPNYSSEYHSSGMSRILNNYSYNFRNKNVEILTSETFHSDSEIMSWRKIFDIENLDINESKAALVSPAFLISTVEPSNLNKLESNSFNDTFIYLRIRNENRDVNMIPQLVNEILDNPGVSISKCTNTSFRSKYNNVYFFDYSFRRSLENAEITESLKNIESNIVEILNNQKELDRVIQETTDEQSSLIIGELLEWITASTIEQNNDLTEKLNEIKSTEDVQMKLKLSIPFIKLLGIDFETEFDVKSWSSRMYDKYGFEIFYLMSN